MSERADRPFTELRIEDKDYTDEVSSWLLNSFKFIHRDEKRAEYILLLPHPKHKAMGGIDINEFLEDCPDKLSIEIRSIYESRMKDREDNSWQNGFDLDNDFGFLLVAIV